MKVSVVRGGGFAGLVTTTTADTASLDPGDAEALRAKVGRVDLTAPPPAERGAGPADVPAYKVTVEDDGRVQELRVSESGLTPALRDLISYVGSVPGHEERVE
ncbi:hypothetical protein HNP84_009903 [Thermocatellispora tengchongensis]|uniref:Uncharacterized protein n=1 Tax=Thermocatellispora tengchongensis TaxID=1073253 RepID=A0A840PKU5_9ACTN|nr:protealysin inhibitor emfourin [Thermocatellispora tengchongensis]MBB5140138.1 hypothetical protein [Thermocatellispora tengchongensis]